jgi:hypothetical protein
MSDETATDAADGQDDPEREPWDDAPPRDEDNMDVPAPPVEEQPLKRDQILKLYEDGTTDIAQIVRTVGARPSYVAQVLQQAGYLTGYFDLYTTTSRELNVYSRFYRNVLSFKTVAAAEEACVKLTRLYDYFERLTGMNRARWSGKEAESEVFRTWLNQH